HAPPAAVDAGRRLADPRTVAILTGQQAGLFGGPLFTLLKALTALKLADQVARDHDVPVVAVFWIDAEDHDWEEVRSCTAFDDGLALFHLDTPKGGRRAIRQQDGQFIVGDQQYQAAALMREAEEQPSGFSPNVLLRPIVQDTLFPTVCYVAGPNELAYLGQLRGVYEHFGVPMPLMYPRASATLLDSAATRFLTKYDLSLEALQAQDESALN